MPKRTSSHRSMSQLRQMVWRTEKDAIAELKRNAYPAKGEDYEIREVLPDSWQIVDRREEVSQEPEPIPTKPAAAKKAATKPAPEPEPAVEPQPPTGDDATWRLPLPHEGKPYTIALREGVGFPEHATHTWAIEISDWRRAPVDVLDKNGALVRTVDATKIRRERRKSPAPAGRSTEMADWTKRALELAQSPGGAKRGELNKLREGIGWRSYLERTAKRFGLTFSQDKDADGIVYRLTKP